MGRGAFSFLCTYALICPEANACVPNRPLSSIHEQTSCVFIHAAQSVPYTMSHKRSVHGFRSTGNRPHDADLQLARIEAILNDPHLIAIRPAPAASAKPAREDDEAIRRAAQEFQAMAVGDEGAAAKPFRRFAASVLIGKQGPDRICALLGVNRVPGQMSFPRLLLPDKFDLVADTEKVRAHLSASLRTSLDSLGHLMRVTTPKEAREHFFGTFTVKGGFARLYQELNGNRYGMFRIPLSQVSELLYPGLLHIWIRILERLAAAEETEEGAKQYNPMIVEAAEYRRRGWEQYLASKGL